MDKLKQKLDWYLLFLEYHGENHEYERRMKDKSYRSIQTRADKLAFKINKKLC